MTPRAFAIALAATSGIGFAVLCGQTADATEPAANVGTLTCVASPGDKDMLGPERRLSCTFDPLAGPKASFTGMVKRIGGQAPTDARTVLVWAVLGPTIDATASQLEGRYMGPVGEGHGTKASGLVGGDRGHITLQPLQLDSDLGENAAVAVLELQLEAMKA